MELESSFEIKNLMSTCGHKRSLEVKSLSETTKNVKRMLTFALVY